MKPSEKLLEVVKEKGNISKPPPKYSQSVYSVYCCPGNGRQLCVIGYLSGEEIHERKNSIMRRETNSLDPVEITADKYKMPQDLVSKVEGMWEGWEKNYCHSLLEIAAFLDSKGF